MKRRETFQIESNERIADRIYKMVLLGEIGRLMPGMFVNVEIPGFYLRRPISVCDAQGDRLTLIYKEVGGGTKRLSSMKAGEDVDIIIPLGNGFAIKKDHKKVLVIGGGVGVPPLYLLCKRLAEHQKEVHVILGFNRAEDVFYKEEFEKLAKTVTVMTADGSRGEKGFVTDCAACRGDYDFFYACGPMPMLKALCKSLSIPGQLSLEERMACGFGACMGCSIQTKSGMRRVCLEGPVFERSEIIWE